MSRRTVHREMNEWDGREIHRYSLQQQVILRILMRFTENFYMTCIRNSCWQMVWYRKLYQHLVRVRHLVHGEMQHVSFRGMSICSVEIRPYWNSRLTAWKHGWIISERWMASITDGETHSITVTGWHSTVREQKKEMYMVRQTKLILQTSIMQPVRRLLRKQQEY